MTDFLLLMVNVAEFEPCSGKLLETITKGNERDSNLLYIGSYHSHGGVGSLEMGLCKKFFLTRVLPALA